MKFALYLLVMWPVVLVGMTIRSLRLAYMVGVGIATELFGALK